MAVVMLWRFNVIVYMMHEIFVKSGNRFSEVGLFICGINAKGAEHVAGGF